MCIYRGPKIEIRRTNVCGCITNDPEVLYIPVYSCQIFEKCTKIVWDEKQLPACTKCNFANGTKKENV